MQEFDFAYVDILGEHRKDRNRIASLESISSLSAQQPGHYYAIAASVTGYGPLDGSKDVSVCLAKEELFPGLLDHIRRCLKQEEPSDPAEILS